MSWIKSRVARGFILNQGGGCCVVSAWQARVREAGVRHFRAMVGRAIVYRVEMKLAGRSPDPRGAGEAGAGALRRKRNAMALKSLVVFVDPTPQGEARARYTIKLAVQHQAHLIGVFISATAWSRNSADGFVRGPAAIREMVERHNIQETDAAAAALKSFETLAGREQLSHEFRLIKEADAKEVVQLHTLHTDLVVSGHPSPGDMPAMDSVDAMLMATGV
ncbi:MAG: hypothetical protein H7316_05910, partial [Tardiphaga sp.]|nr:hypothetical protein [Tardiphaga sp.]